MGALWSAAAVEQRDAAARVQTYLAPDAELTEFYESFKRTVHQLPKDSTATGDAVSTPWTHELDELYAHARALRPSMELQRDVELNEELPTRVEETNGLKESQEEAVLRGLCENPLSTSEAIAQATQKLGLVFQGDRFLRIVAKYPVASRLYVSQQMQASHEIETSIRLHLLYGDTHQAAMIIGKLAHAEESITHRNQRLQEMIELLRRSEATEEAAPTSAVAAAEPSLSLLPGKTKLQSTSVDVNAFHALLVEQELALTKQQEALELQLGVSPLVGDSLVETLQRLFALYPAHPAALTSAVLLAERFKMHPRQFWWSLLKMLTQNQQWPLLAQLAAAPRPPIGYAVIAHALMDHDQCDLAVALLPNVQDSHEREELHTLLTHHEPTTTS